MTANGEVICQSSSLLINVTALPIAQEGGEWTGAGRHTRPGLTSPPLQRHTPGLLQDLPRYPLPAPGKLEITAVSPWPPKGNHKYETAAVSLLPRSRAEQPQQVTPRETPSYTQVSDTQKARYQSGLIAGSCATLLAQLFSKNYIALHFLLISFKSRV